MRGIGKTLAGFILPILLVAEASAQQNGRYAIALRGNGDLQPAHWGALARVVEEKGIPKAQAGGSSAVVTMLYLDSMLGSPALARMAPETKRLGLSLMLKSLEGFAQVVASSEDTQLLAFYYQRLPKNMEELRAELEAFLQGRREVQISPEEIEDLARAMRTLRNAGFLPDETYAEIRLLLEAPSEERLEQARFLVQEVRDAIKAFGAFDAQTDVNLFFRRSLVNFTKVARQFAKVAMFYGQISTSGDYNSRFKSWLGECSKDSQGKLWKEIALAKPRCQSELQSLMSDYFARLKDDEITRFLNTSPGRHILTLPTTTVIRGASFDHMKRSLEKYRSRIPMHPEASQIPNREDLRFGYWGPNRTLQRISETFKEQSFVDEKSRRFHTLGPGTWLEVLTTSPAEPGMSPLVPFTDDKGERLFSAGGWSDLHPVQVLRAAGFERVVYVTRKGSESHFAQGVAKRLLGLEKPWDHFGKDPETGKVSVLSLFDEADQTSIWSFLYNLANPKSAFSVALDQADEVVLTDWNRFSLKQGTGPMVEQAYRSESVDLRRRTPRERVQILNP